MAPHDQRDRQGQDRDRRRCPWREGQTGTHPYGVSYVPTETRQGVVDRNRISGTDTAAPLLLEAPRNANGRFALGNPGRPRGSRNKTTQAAQALLEDEAEALTRKAVDLALAGDTRPCASAWRAPPAPQGHAGHDRPPAAALGPGGRPSS